MILAALLVLLPPAQRDALATASFVDARRLVLDGDPREWAAGEADVRIDRPEQFVELAGRAGDELWSGPEDCSLELWVGWNDADLVVGGVVLDQARDHDEGRWYHGDGIELFLSVLDRAPEWGPDDWQVMLAPDWAERPWGVYAREGQARGGAMASHAGFGGVEVASVAIEGGYRFEARLPWANFGSFRPVPLAELPFNVAICDRDQAGPRPGTPLESYGTWNGQSELARLADRRGRLVLEAPEGDRERAEPVAKVERGAPRPLLFLALAALYGVALMTRRVWRSARSRRLGFAGSAVFVAAALGAAWLARANAESERALRRAGLEAYWAEFEQVLRSGALGHPEPAALVADVDALLSGRAVAPVFPGPLEHLAPEGARLLEVERTARRGIPFRPFEPAPASAPGAPSAPSADRAPPEPGAAAAPPRALGTLGPGAARAPGPESRPADPARAAPTASGGPGLVLLPGESCVFTLDEPLSIDAVHLVTRVSDPRFLDTDEQVRVLSVELSRRGLPLPEARDVRHRQDLHHEEDDHRDHPGLEPAFHRPGGRLGNVHADALLLELGGPREVDQVVVRHVGEHPGYAVRLLAAGLRRYQELVSVPAGLQANAAGDWVWGGRRADVDAEVLPLGRAPRSAGSARLTRLLVIGRDSVGTVSLLDTRPPGRGSRLSFLPIGALAGVAPFLVALFAEWLGTRRRIRGKLAVGFVLTSAIPLLALTFLLEASLSQAHELDESERAQRALARAEADLERLEHELESEAAHLLRIALLERERGDPFPKSTAALAAWWGDGGGTVRLLEYTEADGRRKRVGTGPGWREVPARWELRSGLIRPWGRLLVAGVARTRTGAPQPLAVVVGAEPPIPGASASAAGSAEVRLLGAGRDPEPTVAELAPASAREIRRPLLGREQGELAGVLSIALRERGVPVLGNYSLTELLLALGITAVFTALLFAGILTGHIVGPIERLDRAVRSGTTDALEPMVEDEIGHLTRAIRSFSSEVSHRVAQLETLQNAHEQLSSRLDAEQAREAVLAFFARETGAQRVWLLWGGDRAEEPRLFGSGGVDLPLAPEAGFLRRALASTQVSDVTDAPGMPAFAPPERERFEACTRVLGLPLLAAGECRGALLLGWAEPDPRFDLAYLRTAAGQAAIVLENARLYQRAVSDPVSGFLFEPAFRQRLTEEIRRAQEVHGAGVLVVKVRLADLPEDDEQAAERLRAAAQRVRLAVPGLALFGRSGVVDLAVAVPWTEARPGFASLERRIAEEVSRRPWPDGESVRGLLCSHAAWPDDGPSGRFVLQVLEERLVDVHSAAPLKSALAGALPADFVAESPAMVELVDTVRRIAERDVTVLVSGETGVGKGRIAELLHRFSPRRAGTLLHVHCPSLSEGLIEDELFGHEAGAFTGAHSRRVGPFEYAAGGTVVLDEVGGLSPDGQVALLRLIETREVKPLGATRTVPLDVRIVATTSRDLALDVERGRFRGDLFFRLNVAQISVPPLRLRRLDLPELVASAVRRFNASADRPVTGVDPRVLDLLFEHPWPGNLRELENVLARALILADGGELRPEFLELERMPAVPGGDAGPAAGAPLNPRQEALLAGLVPGQRISSTEHGDRHGISSRTALRDLVELVGLGLLAREGSKRGARFRRVADPERVRNGP